MCPFPVMASPVRLSSKDASKSKSEMHLTVLPGADLVTAPGAAPSNFDFGQVGGPTYAPVVHQFVFTNQSNTPVTLDRITPSCSCTTASIPFDIKSGGGYTMVVKPKQELGVMVSLNLELAGAGPVHKTVWLFVKGQAAPAATLTMEGLVLPLPDFSDPDVTFGDVKAGSELSRLETVSVNTSSLPVGSKWTVVSSNPDVQVAEIPNPATGASADPGTQARSYKVTLPSTAHLGTVGGRLSVLFSVPGCADTVSGFVPILGSVAGDISSLPATLAFGDVPVGQTTKRQAFIMGTDLDNLTVTSGSPYITATVTTQPAPANAGAPSRNVTILTATISADAPLGSLSSSLTVATPGGQQLLIPVYADVAKAEVTSLPGLSPLKGGKH